MPKFVLAYHGKPDIETEEEGAAHMETWKAWCAGLGDAVIDPGMPVSTSKTVTVEGVKDGGGSNPLSGITIIEAVNIDEAITMTKGCPHINGNGTIEVAEAMQM